MGDVKDVKEKTGSEEDEYYFADIADEEIEDWVSDDEYDLGADEDADLDDLDEEVKEPSVADVNKMATEKVEEEEATPAVMGENVEKVEGASLETILPMEEPGAEEEEVEVEVDLRSPIAETDPRQTEPQSEEYRKGINLEADMEDMGDVEQEQAEQVEQQHQQQQQQWGLGGLWGGGASDTSSDTKPASGGGWGNWGKSFTQAVTKASSSLNAAVEGASKDWAELQHSVAAVVAPPLEPGQEVEAEEEEEGAGKEAKVSIEDEKKREKLFAKFEEAGEDDEIDHRLKVRDSPFRPSSVQHPPNVFRR
jgi:hypothetical protein